MTGRYCDECGKLYEAERVTSQYCSDKCRVAAHRRQNARLDAENAQEVASLRFMSNGNIYRAKLFPNTLWIERQGPHADNIPFDRNKYARVYWGEYQTWNIDVLALFVEDYEAELVAE